MKISGIIPAYAGLTLGNRWNPNVAQLYQAGSTFTGDLAPAQRRSGSVAVVRRSTTTPSRV